MKRLFFMASALALTLVAAADAALAEMSAIYGPVYVVSRNHAGKDRETKLRFTAPVPGNGKIVVKNGGESGKQHRVSSATIELNERKIAKQSDFNKRVDTLQYDVTLKAYNVLEVRVESCKECQLEITVLGEKPAPPPPAPAAPPAPLLPAMPAGPSMP